MTTERNPNMTKERNLNQLEKLTLVGLMFDSGFVIYSFYTQKINLMLLSIIIFCCLLAIHIIAMVLEDKRNENSTRM